MFPKSHFRALATEIITDKHLKLKVDFFFCKAFVQLLHTEASCILTYITLKNEVMYLQQRSPDELLAACRQPV